MVDKQRRFRLRFFALWLLLLGLLGNFLSCTANPREFLVTDASMVHEGQTMKDCRHILGAPDAIKRLKDGHEAWYYYHTRKYFYQKIPLLGQHLGRPKVEILEVKFVSGRVTKVTFYEVDEGLQHQ